MAGVAFLMVAAMLVMSVVGDEYHPRSAVRSAQVIPSNPFGGAVFGGKGGFVDGDNADPCPPVMCMLYCEHGFALGADGCPRCSCNSRPISHVCPPVMCMIACPHGFLTDQHGCPRCACGLPPIPVRPVQ